MVIVEEKMFFLWLWRIEFPMDIPLSTEFGLERLEFNTLFAAMIRRPEVFFALHFCKYWFIMSDLRSR